VHIHARHGAHLPLLSVAEQRQVSLGIGPPALLNHLEPRLVTPLLPNE
jgi:hypothetical protein